MNNDDYKDIDRYLSDDMTEEERILFEQRLENEPDLKEALYLSKDIDVAIRNKHAIEFIDLVKQDMDRRRPHHMPTWWRTRRRYYGMAAIITILVTIGLLLNYFSFSGGDKDKTLLALYQPERIDYTFRSDDLESTELLIQEGIIEYNSGKFDDAAVHFEKAISDKPASIQLKFYYGLSLIYSGKIKAGQKIMQSIIESHDLLYSKEAMWQNSYCLIRMGQVDSAKSIILELREDSYYAEKAEKALDLIK